MKTTQLNKIAISIACIMSGAAIFSSIYTSNIYAQAIIQANPNSNPNVLNNIDVSGNSQNALINIVMKDAIGKPNISVLPDSRRFVVDIPNSKNGTKPSFTYNHALLKDVSISTIDGNTRMVFNLNKTVKHEATINNNTLSIKLSNLEKDVAVSNNYYASNNIMHAPIGITGIDFQRGVDGSGKILIDLASKDTVVDVKQIGSTLSADFINTKASDSLKRNFDVNDFATPAKNMRLTTNGNGTKLSVDTKGAWRYSSYQANDKFVIEIHPVKPESKALASANLAGSGSTDLAKGKYKGQKLSLNFQDIDVRSLMQVFADFTNLNIVVNDNVQGNLTLRLKDVPWDQAFDIVLQTKNLASKRNGSVIWVAPKDEMLAKEKQELESRAQIAELEPLRTQNIQLNYHKADVVAKGLLGEGEGAKSSPIISKRGSLTYDTRTNQIFVTDTAKKIDEVNTLIQKIDIPVRQVIIEARIVEANDTFGRNLGMKLGFADLRSGRNAGFGGIFGNNRIGLSGNQTGTTENFDLLKKDAASAKYDMANTNFLSLPASGINGFNPASLGLSLFTVGATTLLNLELSALEADGKGKIVSSPKILTTDKQKAIIEQGTELPYESATSSGATAIQFKKANLKLEVTPQITPEGKVFLDVDINKDSPSAITNGRAGLAIDTKHVQTQVFVDNGGTVMIGGIFEESERKNTTKVPLLGDLPVVGNLFKTTSRNRERTELLIFLTPKVIEIGTSLGK
jgi:type IV pilus assembly protein PilQ